MCPHRDPGFWIVKVPSMDYRTGCRIFPNNMNATMDEMRFRVSADVLNYIDNGESHAPGAGGSRRMRKPSRLDTNQVFVVQRYINDLPVIDNRDWELRAFVMVRHSNMSCVCLCEYEC